MAEQLRIVLLGMPASGKSSLLGALAVAGESQSAQLGGVISDVSSGLSELKGDLYKKGPAPTTKEVRDYAFSLGQAAPGADAPVKATVTDCSGPAAQAILAAKDAMPVQGPLAQALLGADAVVVLVDAGATVEQQVATVSQFLQLFQDTRGERADIAGLPIYVVLTKCDLIAKPGDSYNQWLQRIEESKRKLDQQLQAAMQAQGALPFGRLDLHVWATAVKRPALADRPAKAEPFGVAELFRQTLPSAQEHRQQRDQASGRLSMVVTAMFGLVAALLVLAGSLYLLRPSAELTALENQIERVLQGPTVADRLREPLEERLKELAQIQENPQYQRLQPKQRQEVEQASREIEQYHKLHKEFLAQVPDPRFATRDEELDKIEKSLDEFALPAEYRTAWQETKLARRMQQWRLEVQNLRQAEKDEEAWMQQQAEEAQKLVKQVIAKGLPAERRDTWFKEAQEYLDREPRHKRTDRLAPGTALTYDHVYKLQRVEQARKSWDRAKDSVRDLRKIVQ